MTGDDKTMRRDIGEIPDHVLGICRALAAAGETAYLVGGSVRDLLSGGRPTDWDLATTARPEQVMKVFRRVVPTGILHGTVTVMIGELSVEVTTLRGEGAYSDGRRPDVVVFLDSIEADLARRDFTINAIAWEPASGTLHDPFEGRRDLSARLIRAVGDPSRRFAEDGLRVMRAARFAATLEMEVDPATLAAMGPAAPTLARVSAERKRDELLKTLSAREPSRGLALMGSAGMLPHLAPRLGALAEDPPAWAATLRRVDAVSPDPASRMAALLVDLGPGAGAALEALRLDRRTSRRAAHLVSLSRPGYDEGWSDGRVRRYLGRAGREEVAAAVELARADAMASGGPPGAIDALRRRIEACLEAGHPVLPGDLAVSGTDVMEALGMAPGPRVGVVLDRLMEHVLDHPADNTRAVLLGLAKGSTPDGSA
jgi:tRNA nucleotidyltransferase (CCA-adding enzyme)